MERRRFGTRELVHSSFPTVDQAGSQIECILERILYPRSFRKKNPLVICLYEFPTFTAVRGNLIKYYSIITLYDQKGGTRCYALLPLMGKGDTMSISSGI